MKKQWLKRITKIIIELIWIFFQSCSILTTDREENIAASKEWSENRQQFWFNFFVFILKILTLKNNFYELWILLMH